jgi:rhomboid protease GluP
MSVPTAEASNRQSARRRQGETPWVTYALLGSTVLVYLLQVASQNILGFDLLAALGVKDNPSIIQGQYWRLITPVFLHASILHIGFNMYALFVLGPGLERFLGHSTYAITYFLSGLAGNVFSFLLSPNPSLGASTAIFGIIGAQTIFIFRNRALFGTRARPLLFNSIFIIVINLGFGILPGSNIDNWGHLGGLIFGGLFAWFGSPAYRPVRPDGVLYPDQVTNSTAPPGSYTIYLNRVRSNTAPWVAALALCAVLVALVILKVRLS